MTQPFCQQGGLLRALFQVQPLVLPQSMTIGLDKKPYNAKPVGGASCPAVMVLETTSDFFTGQPIKPDG